MFPFLAYCSLVELRVSVAVISSFVYYFVPFLAFAGVERGVVVFVVVVNVIVVIVAFVGFGYIVVALIEVFHFRIAR